MRRRMMMNFNTVLKSVPFKQRMMMKKQLIEELEIKPRTFEAYLYGRTPITEKKQETICKVFKDFGIDIDVL